MTGGFGVKFKNSLRVKKYFTKEEQDGQIVRQMKPRGEMLQFMLNHLNKE